MNRLTAILLAFVAPAAAAQSAPVAPTPSCAAELEWISDYAARNYAGFDVKVIDATRPAYESLLGELRPAAASVAVTAECDAILARWREFFQDGHLSFGRRSTADAAGSSANESPDAIRARFADWESTELTEKQARATLDSLGASREPLEGVWESVTGAYRVAVLRDRGADRDFTMTILRADSVWWVPGQMKATFTHAPSGGYDVRFYMLDHSERQWKGEVRRNMLLLDQGSTWLRVWPDAPDDVSRDEYLASQNTRFAARELAPGTVLVHIPTFGNPRGMDSLFAAEGDRIRGADRLIIDVRGNGGGSDFNYRELIPLIYTHPFTIVSSRALATEENILAQERLAADTTFPEAQRAQLARLAAQMRTAKGGWLDFPDRVHREPRVLEKPRRIAVLTDRGCASSCEQFLLAARKSRKVTVYGDRTAGILDFGNVRSAHMPEGTLVLNHPVTRSKRVPHAAIDNVGIQPHVRIPSDELVPIDWVLRRMEAGDDGR